MTGFYLEQVLGFTFNIRPFGVDPDFIFIDRTNRRPHLIQAKSHLHATRLNLTDAINLIDVLAKSKIMRQRKYVGDLVVVGITSPSSFEVRHLELEEV